MFRQSTWLEVGHRAAGLSLQSGLVLLKCERTLDQLKLVAIDLTLLQVEIKLLASVLNIKVSHG